MTIEQLLNRLIQRGWKPRNCNYQKYEDGCLIYEKMGNNGVYSIGQYPVSLREITSKNSGLWQFVCENGMYKKNAGSIYFNDERAKNVFYKIDQFDEEGDVIQTGDMKGDSFIHISEPEYRLIESSLRDESELEDFLLQNIKVGNED